MPWISSTTGVLLQNVQHPVPRGEGVLQSAAQVGQRHTAGQRSSSAPAWAAVRPAKSTCPAWYSPAAAKSMATIKHQDDGVRHRLVAAGGALHPRLVLGEGCGAARPSPPGGAGPGRTAAFPNRPRRLSSTKLESSPERCRNRMPSSPLSLEVTSGTATPTTA